MKRALALGRFDRQRPFRPWLLRIVANEAKNRRRWMSRHATLELETEPAAPGAPTPETQAEERERRAALLGAVNGSDTRTER